MAGSHVVASKGVGNMGTNESLKISEQVSMCFVDDEGVSDAFDAQFEFDPTDPCAVSITFCVGVEPVTWTFSRDLLIEGSMTPTGEGDLHVFPCLSSEGSAVVLFDLDSPDGSTLIQCSSRVVDRFIERMLDLVPADTETQIVDNAMAAFLDALFTSNLPNR